MIDQFLVPLVPLFGYLFACFFVWMKNLNRQEIDPGGKIEIVEPLKIQLWNCYNCYLSSGETT